MRRMRHHLSYANVMATTAVFLSLGGTAAAALVITGQDVRDGSLTGRDIRNASLTTSDILPGTINSRDVGFGSLDGGDIADGSLRSEDFRPGEVPRGSAGPRGDAGPKGDAGARGAAGPQGDAGPSGPTGPAGADGADGTSTITVRTASAPIPVSCFPSAVQGVSCTGRAAVTASCEPGERATGGGNGPATATSQRVLGGADRPDPTTGTPTGWTVDMQAFSDGQGPATSLESADVHVVCASAGDAGPTGG